MSEGRPLSAGLRALLAGVMLSGTGLVCFVVGGYEQPAAMPASSSSEPSVSTTTAADPVLLLPAEPSAPPETVTVAPPVDDYRGAHSHTGPVHDAVHTAVDDDEIRAAMMSAAGD